MLAESLNPKLAPARHMMGYAPQAITSEEADEVYDILVDCLGEEAAQEMLLARLSADDSGAYQP